MKVLKIPIKGNIEIIDIEGNLYDYFDNVIGAYHIDTQSSLLEDFAIVHDDGDIIKKTNKIASKLLGNGRNSIWGDCFVLKTSPKYEYHDLYENAISITEEDKNIILEAIKNKRK